MSLEIEPYRGTRTIVEADAARLPARRPSARRARSGQPPPRRPVWLGWRPADAVAAYRAAGVAVEAPAPTVDVLA
jgi:hypothetical protein